ncbi:hypothetical protein TruAng_010048 [Truncatella angustata]|nr:hypothetical protein TruAng_010048 [Truncatella angustata]
MDYHSIHGQDIASFDLPSTHRLPTVSAADALEELDADPARFLATGLSDLDEALNPDLEDASQNASRPGGFQRGQVIEIWGPPGSGKTTFGLQLAADALKKGGKVVWMVSDLATRMQTGRGATLIPAINTSSWDQGIATRLALFRDWSFQDDHVSGIRFAGIQKLNGKAHFEGIGPTFAFEIYEDGIVSVIHDVTQASVILSSTPHPKRKLGETEFEIADSEDEEYGWDNEDSAQLPPNPSQWQGSEDILIGRHDEDGNRRDNDDLDEQSIQSDVADPNDDINYLDDGSI